MKKAEKKRQLKKKKKKTKTLSSTMGSEIHRPPPKKQSAPPAQQPLQVPLSYSPLPRPRPPARQITKLDRVLDWLLIVASLILLAIVTISWLLCPAQKNLPDGGEEMMNSRCAFMLRLTFK
jgi:hypothetical protein